MLYVHPPEVAAAASTRADSRDSSADRCDSSFIHGLTHAVTTEEWEELGASALRVVRDGVLFLRLYIFLKNRRKNQARQAECAAHCCLTSGAR